MANKASPGKLLLRLGIVIVLVGLLFLLSIRLINGFRNIPSRSKNKIHTSFGIVLPSGYTVHGIDVSRHQEVIEWEKVDSMHSGGEKIDFVFIKATEGITRQDPNFETNWKAIKKTKLIRGAYHFYYPTRDASMQARNFISQVSLSKGDLPPVADIEHSGGKSKKKICEGLAVFLNKLEKKYKVKPIIYTNLSFYNDYLMGEFDSYPLWISCYYDEDRFKSSCAHEWTFWQHSERGKVNGIAGNVDFNVLNGSIEDLKKLCIP
jgi:lysozyme